MQFNTAIASMMELLNHAYKYKEGNNVDEKLFGFFVYIFIILLNPLIPHLSNELWSKSNFKNKDINKLWIKNKNDSLTITNRRLHICNRKKRLNFRH